MPYDLSSPLRALHLALDTIEQYQLDIRNSAWTGVNLQAKGFCQGRFYLETTARLREVLRQWEQDGHDSSYDGV